METLTTSHDEETPLLKPENDMSEETNALIRAQRAAVAENRTTLQAAIDVLLQQEKKTRLGGDFHSTTELSVEVVRLAREVNDWAYLNEKLLLVTRRRGQFKQAVARAVREAMTYLDQTPTPETKLALIDTLRTITEGKIYVEVERARLTKLLAKIREAEGNLHEAATVIQEVAVETCGSMDRREKFEFLLTQMEMCLNADEFIRAQLISKKVGHRALGDKNFQDLKVRFYELMIRYYLHNKNWLETSRSYQHIFNTEMVQEKQELWAEALRSCVVYAILSPYDAEQLDLVLRIQKEKKLRELPNYQLLLKRYVDETLVQFETVLETDPATGEGPHRAFTDMATAAELTEELRKRTIEHNIRVIAKFYQRIAVARLAAILGLSPQATEDAVSKMVTQKIIYAKIDRIDGTITFARSSTPDQILSNWSRQVSELLALVETSCQSISRENMVYKVDAAVPAAEAQ